MTETPAPGGERVWVLADPRAGTAAQALGIAERLGEGFRAIPLAWSPLARLPMFWPTLAGLKAQARAAAFQPPWPRLVISAGRRAAPVALWLAQRGARAVHCMRPGFGARCFDLLVLGRHDSPPDRPNIMPILGATHRVSPERLAEARAAWAEALAPLPAPRVALLLGGPVRGEGGFDPAATAALGARVASFAGTVLATTSRRTGHAATEALAAALAGAPHRLFRWGEAGPNPYLGFLAWADAAVVSGDSVSMISEALATAAPVFIAGSGREVGGPRHRRLHESLYEAGQARPFSCAPAPFARAPLDESGRVAAAVRARGLLAE
jgi:mitochondrial fission protein ELM1